MPENTLREGDNDPDEDQIDETSDSVRRATEHIRLLWAKMNKDRDETMEREQSKSEDAR